MAFAALGYGSLLGRLLPQSFAKIDRLALILLGGLGLLGTLLFDVGQVWFTRTLVVLLVLPGAFLGIKLFAEAARKPNKVVPRATPPALPVIVVVGVLLLTAVGGLAEPTGDMENDAIAYHFLGPRVWLRDRVIRPVSDQSYTAFPATVETSYAALMALGGQRAPAFFAVIALSAILLIAAGITVRLGMDTARAWWAAALIATMPAVYIGSYGGFIDAVYAAFVLAAARIGFDAEQTSHYMLFGIFCGFAIGTKYTGLIAWAVLTLSVFVASVFIRKKDYGSVLKHLGIAGAVAVAVASPFYVRNWILLGCPICPPPPVLSRFFHVKYLPPEAIRAFHEYIWRRGQGMGRGPLSFFLLPFNLTYHTANFNGAGGIGLTPLALGPFGVIACRRNTFAKGLSFLALLLTAAWFVTEQESRFLIHVYAIGAIFAVFGWQYVARVAPRFAPALSCLVVACSILYGLAMIVPERVNDLHAVVSSSFAEKRRREEIPFLDSFDYLNRQPSVGKVLILDPFVPAYYSEKSYLKPMGVLGEQTLPEATNLELILFELPRSHVSHVLDVSWKGKPFQLPDHPQRLTLVFQRADQRVYRVN